MKKFFTLIAAAFLAAGVQAQVITFTAGEKPTEGFAAGDFKLTYVDDDSKIVVDANNCYFGTATEQTKFSARLKTGGKSSSKNNLTAKVPAAGVLKIAVRTGSNSATDRNVVIAQNGTELYNKVVLESDAIKVKGLDEAEPEKETNVYPYITVNVEAGDVNITYPVGSVNFYAFEFIGGSAGITNVKANAEKNVIYNLAGQKVAADYKGIAIKNGKKVVLK